MDIPLGITFDDVLLVPQLSSVSPREAKLETQLTKKIRLEMPIISAAMDTVTEAKMVIAMSNAGGLGILHRNCTVGEQVKMVMAAKKKQARVGAAVGPHDIKRALALDKVGVDVVVVDSAHVHKPKIISDVKLLKRKLKAEIIVGNIATATAASAFLPYADALKVGVGPGAICTTRVVAGVGVPQLTAIMEVAKMAKEKKIPVIADGGIRYSGDIAKAIGAGASAVMLGSVLAGTTEAPGDIITIAKKQYKRYRGMGSLGAMERGQSSDRYGQKGATKYVPEGVEGVVPFHGAVADILFHMTGGLRASMGYSGAKTIVELQKKATFIRITPAGRAESHPHSITIEKQAPNYR
ncbi:guanosine monophosphate reductase [Candidatus Uhrbacteria bacterium CG10_big_fil_rev_8_21_14_0_10_48_11]|uniref:Guanosine monophosphate reductase n=1 Tax=Candidatus Uhrbacteria bacterium CG10_big_fil_rev_8_21_14_0_10_48_11 TaxID=1975037 RepID=A0A2M8LDS2_9BACT|nr:MAG: guanosine monophosphate reductase [Candidatus Uhrbacteria bacterium CG10_big_fil_rev_8_21_14_0_10_48_11]